MGRDFGSWTCLPPSSPTGAHWCLKCSLSLGPFIPKFKLEIGALINFHFECVDINADLEYSLGPALCLSETVDALRGTFQL